MTGIPYREQGCFEKALNATMFLDEIEDIPLSYQEVLLRALQERSVTKLGSSTHIDIKSVRIIAATNKDIVKEVEEEPDRFKDILWNILEKIKQNGDSQLNDLRLDGDALRFIYMDPHSKSNKFLTFL